MGFFLKVTPGIIKGSLHSPKNTLFPSIQFSAWRLPALDENLGRRGRGFSFLSLTVQPDFILPNGEYGIGSRMNEMAADCPHCCPPSK